MRSVSSYAKRKKMSQVFNSTESSTCFTDAETITNSSKTDIKPWPGDLAVVENKFTRLGLIDSAELGEHADLLMLAIRKNNRDLIKRILAEYSHKVDIKPRIGCASLHYTMLNIVNHCLPGEDSPLIKQLEWITQR